MAQFNSLLVTGDSRFLNPIKGAISTVEGIYTANGGQQPPNYFGKNRIGFLMSNVTVNSDTHFKNIMYMDCYQGGDVGGVTALALDRQEAKAFILQSDANRTSWNNSAEIYTTASTVAVANGGTGATTAQNARSNLSVPYMYTDTYPTLQYYNGTNTWIKIGTSNTSYGLLPSATGSAGSGHNYLGTSTWYWKYSYIDEMNAVKLNGVTIGSSPKFTDTLYTLSTSGNSIVLNKDGTAQNTITVPYATSAGSATDSTKLPLAGGTMTGKITFNKVSNAIAYTGTKNTYDMIKFVDNTTDTYGNGVVIGGGGATIIGGGESAATIAGTLSGGGDEIMYVCNDGAIKFYSNCNSGASSAKIMTFDTSGNLTVPGSITGTSFSGSADSLKGYFRFYRVCTFDGHDNVAAGWYRVCKISANANYANAILSFTGGWSNGAPTIAKVCLEIQNTSAKLTQLSGFVGKITKVRTASVSPAGTHWLDVYITAQTAAMASCFVEVSGNAIVTESQNPTQPYTDTVTASAEITLANISGIALTSDNYSSYALPLSGGTVTGVTKFKGAASSQILQSRSLVGLNADATAQDGLYLQYGNNTLDTVYFGATGGGNISSNGTKYSGNAATATSATTANQLAEDRSYETSGTSFVVHSTKSTFKTYLSRYNNLGISTIAGGMLVLAGTWSSGNYTSELALGMGDNYGIYYRGNNGSTEQAWQSIGRFTATPTTGQLVITDGTTGGIKSTNTPSINSLAIKTGTSNSVSIYAGSDYKGYVRVNNGSGTQRILCWVGSNDDGVIDINNSSNTCTISLAGNTGKITCGDIAMSSSTTTVTLTKSSGAWTAGTVTCKKWGGIAQIEIQVKGSGTQVAAGTDGFVGKINQPLPKVDVALFGYTGSTMLMGWLDTSGNLSIRASAVTNVASGNGLYVTGTYICA